MRKNHFLFVIIVFSILLLPQESQAYCSTKTTFQTWKRRSSSSSISSISSSAASNTESLPFCLQGAPQFEQWWDTVVTETPRKLEHASFDQDRLRGLRLIRGDSSSSAEKMDDLVVSVPRNLVLHSPLVTKNGNENEMKMDWDTDLAIQLLEEYAKGQEGDIHGYCSLLSRGVPYSPTKPPEPTAPHALRHWSSEQLERISSSKKLLDLHQTQVRNWNAKYDALPKFIQTKFTKENFAWAMEAVHSRSFRGDFGPLVSMGPLPVLLGGFVQIGAIGYGIKSLLESSPYNDTDWIVILCAILAVLPIFILNFAGGGDAVLLPMIDSANHFVDANSSIEYDPFKGRFGLKLGNKCYGKDGQIYISYGKNKSDAELLLNYGFLEGVTVDNSHGDQYEDEYRSKLALVFLQRNS